MALYPKAAYDAYYYAQHINAVLDGHSSTYADNAILDAAQEAKMKPGGRARAFLQHYRDGSGTDMHFSVKQLFDEDKSVRAYAYLRTSLTVGTYEKQHLPVSNIVGNIDLPQYRFSNIDWQYATGSLNVRWRLLDQIERQGGTYLSIEVWCTNMYRWHPDVPRRTQAIHKAAEALQHPKQEYFIYIHKDRANGKTVIDKIQTTHYRAARPFRMIANKERLLIPKIPIERITSMDGNLYIAGEQPAEDSTS